MTSASTYTIQLPAFPCRALAALAGRANLGGDREIVLAVYMAARLGAGAISPRRLSDDARRARAAAARAWVLSLVLPAGLRSLLTGVADAASADGPAAEVNAGVADALALVADAAAGQLDGAVVAELSGLVAALREPTHRPALPAIEI